MDELKIRCWMKWWGEIALTIHLHYIREFQILMSRGRSPCQMCQNKEKTKCIMFDTDNVQSLFMLFPASIQLHTKTKEMHLKQVVAPRASLSLLLWNLKTKVRSLCAISTESTHQKPDFYETKATRFPHPNRKDETSIIVMHLSCDYKWDRLQL